MLLLYFFSLPFFLSFLEGCFYSRINIRITNIPFFTPQNTSSAIFAFFNCNLRCGCELCWQKKIIFRRSAIYLMPTASKPLLLLMLKENRVIDCIARETDAVNSRGWIRNLQLNAENVNIVISC